MSSLFSTLTLSVLRLIIIKGKSNAWLQSCEFTWKETRVLPIIWQFSLSFALPPFLGFGRYGKDIVGVRYYWALYQSYFNLYMMKSFVSKSIFIFLTAVCQHGPIAIHTRLLLFGTFVQREELFRQF